MFLVLLLHDNEAELTFPHTPDAGPKGKEPDQDSPVLSCLGSGAEIPKGKVCFGLQTRLIIAAFVLQRLEISFSGAALSTDSRQL